MVFPYLQELGSRFPDIHSKLGEFGRELGNSWRNFLFFMASAVLGRILMKNIPSAEPIIAFATFYGFVTGNTFKGFLFGSSTFFVSNFFVGGQGIWSIPQSIGAGISGIFGALFSKYSNTRFSFLTASLLGCIVYELLVNIFFAYFWNKGIVFFMLTSLPFSLIHIVSTIISAFVLWKIFEG